MAKSSVRFKDTVATYDRLVSEAKARKFAPVYLLMGEEAYFIDSLCDLLATTILPDEASRAFSQYVVYGRDVEAGQVVNLCRQMPMTGSHQVVIVKEGSDVTMDNLGEKMIGCQRGTTGYIYASDVPENGGYGEDHVTAYDNGMTAVQALLNGQVDCVIIDSAPAAEFVAANPGLALLEGNWVEESYAIGMNKDNTALQTAVNAALAELIADGTVQSIVDKYISAK